MNIKLILLSCILFASLMIQGQTERTILSNINLIDPATESVREGVDIILLGDKIDKIKPHSKKQPEGRVIDLPGKWVLPGMIDAHIHFFQSGGLYTRPDAIDLRKIVPYEEERKRNMDLASDFMQRYLSCGITTVCDMGGPFSNYDLRTFADSASQAPDVYVTGPLISSYQPEEFGASDPPIIKVESPEAARELVRRQIPFRPDFIKIWYIVMRGEKPEDHLPVVKAAIEESKLNHIPVAVHATQLETARLAVEAGAEILVHSVDDKIVDREFIELLLEKKVTYIPTLVVSENYTQVLGQHPEFGWEDFNVANPFVFGTMTDLRGMEAGDRPDWINRMMGIPFSRSPKVGRIYENLVLLYEAGVNIVTGTDAGNIGTMHASSYYEELRAMKEAGLTNWQILKAATINGNKMAGMKKHTGVLQTGKPSNMVILNQNPVENLDAISEVFQVWKDGREFDPQNLIANSAEFIAQKQLNAYNMGNIDAFVSCYAEDVEVYAFPDQLLYKGRETMRKNYGTFFENNPQLHCRLENRIIHGNRIIDHEYINGLEDRGDFRAVAVYEVENGLIRKVWFFR